MRNAIKEFKPATLYYDREADTYWASVGALCVAFDAADDHAAKVKYKGVTGWKLQYIGVEARRMPRG